MTDSDPLSSADVVKVDSELGLVLGWAIICTEGGEPYFDMQGDHIPEASMLKAATDFMAGARVAKEMHVGGGVGNIVFAWPMTTEVAKAFGVSTNSTGLMIALKPSNPSVLAKFKSGELTGFSIGGKRIEDKELPE